jgi:hypothetical protein
VLQKTLRTVEKGRESLRGRFVNPDLADQGLSGALPTTDREPALDPEGVPASRAPSQFYDHEMG